MPRTNLFEGIFKFKTTRTSAASQSHRAAQQLGKKYSSSVKHWGQKDCCFLTLERLSALRRSELKSVKQAEISFFSGEIQLDLNEVKCVFSQMDFHSKYRPRGLENPPQVWGANEIPSVAVVVSWCYSVWRRKRLWFGAVRNIFHFSMSLSNAVNYRPNCSTFIVACAKRRMTGHKARNWFSCIINWKSVLFQTTTPDWNLPKSTGIPCK